jgi:hypothetical protein
MQNQESAITSVSTTIGKGYRVHLKLDTDFHTIEEAESFLDSMNACYRQNRGTFPYPRKNPEPLWKSERKEVCSIDDLKKALKKEGITIEEFAKTHNCTPTHIYKIRTGRTAGKEIEEAIRALIAK